MSKEIIRTAKSAPPPAAYSRAVNAAGLVFAVVPLRIPGMRLSIAAIAEA